jgi:hypothetical protein
MKSVKKEFTADDAITLVDRMIRHNDGIVPLATSLNNSHDALQTHPYVSLVACCFIDNVPYLFTSDISDHGKNIQTYNKVSILVDSTDIVSKSRLNGARATFIGKVVLVDKELYRDNFLLQHIKAKVYFDFEDFRMYRLNVESIRLNAGFGKASWLYTTIQNNKLVFDKVEVGI